MEKKAEATAHFEPESYTKPDAYNTQAPKVAKPKAKVDRKVKRGASSSDSSCQISGSGSLNDNDYRHCPSYKSHDALIATDDSVRDFLEVDTKEITQSLVTQFESLRLATPFTLTSNWNICSNGHVTTWIHELAESPIRLIWFEVPSLCDGRGGDKNERKQLLHIVQMMQAQLGAGNHVALTARTTNDALQNINFPLR